MNSMNHFIALRPSAEACDRLAALAQRFQAWNLPADWVDPDDYHVTLAFLGHLDAVEAGCMPQAIDLVASSLRRPALELVGLGAAGGRTEPRVVYAALRDAGGLLGDLHRDLCDAAGLTPERAFLPHITLCRPRPPGRGEGPGHGDWRELLTAHGQAEWGPLAVSELVLFQSQARVMPRYRALARWPLAA
jgi:2'-5' RNA ligase